jgi:riboflavin-specific deaminase-like protein
MSSQLKNRRPKLPFVFINMALTADGKIATTNREVHSFGSARDLKHLYELRATADAVVCGARTVEISQAVLGNGGDRFKQRRLKNGLAAFPLRVIVTGSGSIDPAAKIFQQRFSPLIVLTTSRISKTNLATLSAQADEVKILGEREINFRQAFEWLHTKWHVRRLLCEGGGELNDALFRADLVDEIHLTFCPKIFGGRDSPTLADGVGISVLKKASAFDMTSKKVVKDELFTVFLRQKRVRAA